MNKFGIMFHHFHDFSKFNKGPGSISSYQLEKIIKKLGRKNILNPDEFLRNGNQNKVFALTFDDGLKCQYEIAVKILNKFQIKAFFFVFTSIFSNNPEMLEIYRDFRINNYRNHRNFFFDFKKKANHLYGKKFIDFLNNNKKIFNIIKINSPYYSNDEIAFRILRDHFFTNKQYKEIMLNLFKSKKYNYKKKKKLLYMSKKDLINLCSMGHKVGLHTHSHFNNFSELSSKKQEKEFRLNKKILENITKKSIDVASYPFGQFNKYTSNALIKNKIKYSFMKNFNKPNFRINKKLCIPRINHINLLK